MRSEPIYLLGLLLWLVGLAWGEPPGVDYRGYLKTPQANYGFFDATGETIVLTEGEVSGDYKVTEIGARKAVLERASERFDYPLRSYYDDFPGPAGQGDLSTPITARFEWADLRYVVGWVAHLLDKNALLAPGVEGVVSDDAKALPAGEFLERNLAKQSSPLGFAILGQTLVVADPARLAKLEELRSGKASLRVEGLPLLALLRQLALAQDKGIYISTPVEDQISLDLKDCDPDSVLRALVELRGLCYQEDDGLVRLTAKPSAQRRLELPEAGPELACDFVEVDQLFLVGLLVRKLGLSFVASTRVEGQITLRTPEPVSAGRILELAVSERDSLFEDGVLTIPPVKAGGGGPRLTFEPERYWEGVPVKAVLDQAALALKLKEVVLPEDFQAQVLLNLNGVPAERAVGLVLGAAGYTYELSDHKLVVKPL